MASPTLLEVYIKVGAVGLDRWIDTLRIGVKRGVDAIRTIWQIASFISNRFTSTCPDRNLALCRGIRSLQTGRGHVQQGDGKVQPEYSCERGNSQNAEGCCSADDSFYWSFFGGFLFSGPDDSDEDYGSDFGLVAVVFQWLHRLDTRGRGLETSSFFSRGSLPTYRAAKVDFLRQIELVIETLS